jgi:hypothetical protein
MPDDLPCDVTLRWSIGILQVTDRSALRLTAESSCVLHCSLA